MWKVWLSFLNHAAILVEMAVPGGIFLSTQVLKTQACSQAILRTPLRQEGPVLTNFYKSAGPSTTVIYVSGEHTGEFYCSMVF